MSDSDEPFLSRWARLKSEATRPPKSSSTKTAALDPTQADAPAAERMPGPEPADAEAGAKPEEPALDLEKIDFDSLGADSDYKPFMRAEVPDEIRSKALSKLWLSDPVLSGPEQLSDYMEDFTDAARAVPAGTLRTAYKIGQGFLSDEEAAEWDRLGRKEPAKPPAAPQLVVAKESPDQPEIGAFLAASDAYSQSLYPAESNHLVDLSVLMATNAHFFVARKEGKALGCGALIVADDGSGELKRMWVSPEARGQGVGRKLLDAIEATARETGVSVLRLETGIHQPEAIGLYRRSGFVDCGPFGSYQPDPLSLFMEKRLG